MGLSRTSLTSLPPVATKLIAIGVGLVTFLAIASVINPGSSIATPAQNPRDAFPLATAPQGDDRIASLSLGGLEGRDFDVEIWSSPDHPTYTIYDGEGRPVLVGARSDEVYMTLPDLDFKSMVADVNVDF